MAKWNYRVEKLTFEDIRERWDIEQILHVLHIDIDESGKCTCPFHEDVNASLFVNEKNVYCFGCGGSWDSFAFVKAYLQLETVQEVFDWFYQFKSPEKSGRTYEPNKYDGPVDMSLVDYWQSQMTEEHYNVLLSQRLITEETARHYKLGWRPDWDAFTIPFWRGELGKGDVDVLQFRMPTTFAGPKYIGLKGHSRGSVQNAYLLEQEQPYVVILLGAYDSILALQDGLIAVGINGSTVFTKWGGSRLLEYFSKQKHIIIVPDNTKTEYGPAQQLCNLFGSDRAVVKYFPETLPDGFDYIDYRVAGHSVEEFMTEVLDLKPFDRYNVDMVNNLYDLLRAGDPLNFIPLHLAFSGQGEVAANLARALSERVAEPEHKQSLWKVGDTTSLCITLEQIAQSYFYAQGGW